jgi:hypothetical protein
MAYKDKQNPIAKSDFLIQFQTWTLISVIVDYSRKLVTTRD